MSALKAFIQNTSRDKNLSIPELAELAGMPTSTLYKILDSKDVPKMRTLNTIARALEVPLARLIQACGYSLEDIGTPEDEARARAMIAAVPELQEIVGPMADLSPENRGALMAMVRAFVAQVEAEKRRTAS